MKKADIEIIPSRQSNCYLVRFNRADNLMDKGAVYPAPFTLKCSIDYVITQVQKKNPGWTIAAAEK